MATSKEIGRLLHTASRGGAAPYQAKQARKALRAEDRARALARLAKSSVGTSRVLLKEQAARASQRAAALGRGWREGCA